ncbi:hypothetical protein V1291_004792 [Nitrobacteraceae bacterium AZCC 1564]
MAVMPAKAIDGLLRQRPSRKIPLAIRGPRGLCTKRAQLGAETARVIANAVRLEDQIPSVEGRFRP